MKNLLYIKPKLTEKTLEMTQKGVYTFITNLGANKIEIAKGVTARFKVKIKDIKTMVRHGKTKRFARKEGKRANTKIAIVTLMKGEKIKEFEALFEAEKAGQKTSENKMKENKVEKSEAKVIVRSRHSRMAGRKKNEKD